MSQVPRKLLGEPNLHRPLSGQPQTKMDYSLIFWPLQSTWASLKLLQWLLKMKFNARLTLCLFFLSFMMTFPTILFWTGKCKWCSGLQSVMQTKAQDAQVLISIRSKRLTEINGFCCQFPPFLHFLLLHAAEMTMTYNLLCCKDWKAQMMVSSPELSPPLLSCHFTSWWKTLQKKGTCHWSGK